MLGPNPGSAMSRECTARVSPVSARPENIPFLEPKE
jgi:hypothetical protein